MVNAIEAKAKTRLIQVGSLWCSCSKIYNLTLSIIFRMPYLRSLGASSVILKKKKEQTMWMMLSNCFELV